MIMTRRGFLGAILAAGVAPAIVRADSLMRLVPTETLLLKPPAELVLIAMWPGVASWYGDVYNLEIASAMRATKERIINDIFDKEFSKGAKEAHDRYTKRFP